MSYVIDKILCDAMLSRIEPFLSFLFLSVVSGFCLYDFYTRYGLYGGRGLLLQFPYAIYLFTTAHGIIGDIIYCMYVN